MGILSPTHLIIILVIVLIIFGPSRLPQLGKSLGKTMKAIRDGAEGEVEDDDEPVAKPRPLRPRRRRLPPRITRTWRRRSSSSEERISEAPAARRAPPCLSGPGPVYSREHSRPRRCSVLCRCSNRLRTAVYHPLTGAHAMQKEVALTPEGQARLEEELHHLETTRRREVGERIKEAKEFGDLSENSEYDDAKNEQAWVESRIAEISQILAHATIIASPKKNDKVSLGTVVELEEAGTGEKHRYQLVGSAEADPAHDKISNESPVGQAILGAKKGDTVKVQVPSGKVFEYTVVAITH
jgi:transcription elongation factor GreA